MSFPSGANIEYLSKARHVGEVGLDARPAFYASLTICLCRRFPDLKSSRRAHGAVGL
jgi:hypothetical protein